MLDIIISIGKFTLVILAVYIVGIEFYKQRNNLSFIKKVWKQVKIHMFLECAVVLGLIIGVSCALMEIPFLSKGWTALLYDDSSNILIGPVLEGSESSNIWIRVFPPIFFVCLFFMLPFFAHTEEKIFRAKRTSWKEIAFFSVLFGLVHCIVGIPIAIGLALSIAGFFFALKYRKAYFRKNKELLNQNEKIHKLFEKQPELLKKVDVSFSEAVDYGVMHSTVYHTVYNSMLIFLLIIITIMSIG